MKAVIHYDMMDFSSLGFQVQRNYGNADDNTANAHNEHTAVTAMSFSDHIYSPSNLITTTSESSVKPELGMHYFIYYHL